MFIWVIVVEKSNFMVKMSQIQKVCPECEEEMDAVYDKNKVLVCWECSECGTRVLVPKENK
jgi:hypothetical protein